MPSSQKQIYGLIGYPVKHSLSALMHNAAFEALNIPAEYRLFEIEPSKLEGFLLGDITVSDIEGKGGELNMRDIAGFNITIPHKVRAREILEKRSPLSFGKLAQVDQYYVKLSGAINTVNMEDGLYYNTDAGGFLKALESKEEKDWGLGFSPAGKSALVAGSGGAGRAVIAALSWVNKKAEKIYVYDDNPAAVNSAQEHFFNGLLSSNWENLLKRKLEFITQKEKIPEIIKSCDLLVNATPVGMKKDDPSIVDKKWFDGNDKLSVYDVVYNRETQLIRDAKEAGCAAVGGLGMLLYQGVAAFNHWTKACPPIEAMRKSLEEGVDRL